jgi:general secretion pathway protein C
MRRRSIAPFVLATLVLCAWLHARAVLALVGGSLAAPDVHRFAQTAPVSTASEHAQSADPILARNPFDSEWGSRVDARPPPSADDSTQGPCEGVRVAAIVAYGDPAWSFVALEVAGEPAPVLLRGGQGEVVAIGRDRVLLDRGGSRCVARIFAPRGGAPAPAPAADAGAVVRGIEQTGDGSFAVDRAVRDALVSGGPDLMRSVNVVPEKKGDDVIGMRIAALKPGTPLDALGLRAGDVLQTMNGIPLTTPDRLLEAYARVQAAPELRLEVMRNGRQFQLDYVVR